MKPNLSGVERIGARLRMARKEKGFTQDQIAARAGTVQAIIQWIENGNRLMSLSRKQKKRKRSIRSKP